MNPLRFVFFIGCIYSSSILFCQDKTIDFLKTALKKSKDDTTRISILNQLAKTAPDGEWQKYNEEVKSIAEKNINSNPAHPLKNTYLNHLAASLKRIGNNYFVKGNADKALEYLNKSLQTYKLTGDKQGIAVSLNNIGLIYKSRGDILEALEYYRNSLTIMEETEDKQGVASAYNNIGIIHENQGDIIKALEYYKNSLRLKEEIGDKNGAANSFNNIGTIYKNQGDVTKALEYYNKSLRLMEETEDKKGIAASYNNIGSIYKNRGNISKALEYYNKGLEITEEIGDKQGIAVCLHNIGIIYEKNGDLVKALEYFNKSLKTSEEAGNKRGIVYALNNIGLIYEKQGNFTGALKYAGKSLDLAKELKFPENILKSAKFLSRLYKKQGNGLKALEMYELYVLMHDSINNQETRKASFKNQLQYQFEKKAETDSIKNADEQRVKELELTKQKTEKQNLLIFSFTSIVAIVVLLLLAIYFKKLNNRVKRINEDLVKQNIEIEQKKEEINKQAVQIARYQSQMNPHFIFNAINGLQSMVLEEDKITAIQQIQSLSKLLRLTLNNSENEYISIQDEINYLNKYVEFELQRFSKKFKLNFKIDEGLKPESLIPTMIIQPLLENAIKHAGLNILDNGEINVEIYRDKIDPGNLVKIIVTDNGNGISKNISPEKFNLPNESKGIKITKNRIAIEFRKNKFELNDYFSTKSPVFENGPNFGTEVTMIVPYFTGKVETVNS